MSSKNWKTNKILAYSAYGEDKRTPELEQNFYPCDFDKHVTISLDGPYKYWDEVLEIVLPFFYREKIGIVNISREKGNELNFAQNVGSSSLHQKAYLVKNGLFHISTDDRSRSLATSVGAKRSILNDDAQPEEFAREIFDNFNFKSEFAVETLLVGDSYGIKAVDIIPDFAQCDASQLKDYPIVQVRCDLFENWNFVYNLLRQGVRPFVFSKTAPPIPLAPFLKGVRKVNLLVDKNTSAEEVKRIESQGISYSLLSHEDCPETKLNLFECRPIVVIDSWFKKNVDKITSMSYDTRIKSRRRLVSKDGTFSSVYHWKNGWNTNELKGVLLADAFEDEEFQKEADLFYYFKINKNQ